MENTQITQQIKQILDENLNILIAVKKDPSQDAVAAALALYLGLLKNQKNCLVACQNNLTVEFGNLIGVNKVATTIGGNNLIISFDYTEGAIGKVSYNVENNKFNLVIQPKEGEKPPSRDKIEFSYAGANFNAIFLIDCDSYNDLGNIYTQEQKLYSEKPTVNVNFHQNNPGFAKINLQDFTSSSLSEAIAKLLKTLNIAPDPDIATNLLFGIMSATNNLQKCPYTPELFEIIAACLRVGGRLPQGAPPFNVQLSPQKTPPAQSPQPTAQQPPTPPSPDWLTPKIYKGSTLV